MVGRETASAGGGAAEAEKPKQEIFPCFCFERSPHLTAIVPTLPIRNDHTPPFFHSLSWTLLSPGTLLQTVPDALKSLQHALLRLCRRSCRRPTLLLCAEQRKSGPHRVRHFCFEEAAPFQSRKNDPDASGFPATASPPLLGL